MQRVLVIGSPGAGKSTLAMVLLRFLDYSGCVELSGTDLRALDGDSVREEVGLLTQDAHIFDTTVRENLHLGAPRATDDELRAVLARVGLAGCDKSLPGMMMAMIRLNVPSIFIYGGITMELAQKVCTQLVALAAASDEDIRVFVCSPGGHVESGDMVHDVIQFICPRVRTIGSGWVSSAGISAIWSTQSSAEPCHNCRRGVSSRTCRHDASRQKRGADQRL